MRASSASVVIVAGLVAGRAPALIAPADGDLLCRPPRGGPPVPRTRLPAESHVHPSTAEWLAHPDEAQAELDGVMECIGDHIGRPLGGTERMPCKLRSVGGERVERR